ncbi:MAG: molybdopterin-guanine dinucleotide biosynthesis protein B [Syntrophomonadaceae bacterium]|nr:molybdopterin-guanine dinucleotide biosynthesis protein B [Syntrophomonadaceae bacterium]
MAEPVPIISFIGPHNVGKTTILEKVIPHLTARGIKVGVVKHAHRNPDLGSDSKDSARLFNAGAVTVVVSSADRVFTYRRLAREMDISEIHAEIAGDLDLVIAEGYKKEAWPKIEVLRREVATEPLQVNNLVAMVSDFTLENSRVPVFDVEDVDGIAAFIVERFLDGTEGEK